MQSASRVRLLGIPLDPVTSGEATTRLREMLSTPGQWHVMTPNSEMLVEASKNERFRALLNRTALNLPDSIGLLWAARLTGQHLPERVTGVDAVTGLCAELSADHRVFLLGARPGVAEAAANALQRRNPHLRIVGTYAGSPHAEDATEILQKIALAEPHLLLVAYGAPAQDLWIDRYMRDLPCVRVAIGVGGTFDFLAGERKRAPKLMQECGLEWLWRLVQEPSRWKRIWTAVIVFPWLCLRKK